LIGLVGLILALVLIGVNIGLSRLIGGGGEFLAPWGASRGFLFEHTEPYSISVARATQDLVFGRPSTPTENPYFLTIPFLILPIYFPLALIPDPVSARGIWLFITEAALIASAFLSLRLIEFRSSLPSIILLALLSLLLYYSFDALAAGTPAGLLTLLFLGILFSLNAGQDELAGALLVFALLDWEVSLLFLLLVFWKVLSEKRSRVVLGFGMTFAVLSILSFLIYPGWLFPFVIAFLKMAGSDFTTSTFMILNRVSPDFGIRIAQGVTGLIVILLGYEWASTSSSDFRRFVWVVCLTLAATPLIGIRTGLSNLVVLFPGLVLIFAGTMSRWRIGSWLTALLYLIVLAVPWGLYNRFVLLHDQASWDYLFLFFPLFTIGGLYWIRWWIFRAPRTWLEQVQSHPKS
jgi:hypothetical protein